jgi:hypothetical protein
VPLSAHDAAQLNWVTGSVHGVKLNAPAFEQEPANRRFAELEKAAQTSS